MLRKFHERKYCHPLKSIIKLSNVFEVSYCNSYTSSSHVNKQNIDRVICRLHNVNICNFGKLFHLIMVLVKKICECNNPE